MRKHSKGQLVKLMGGIQRFQHAPPILVTRKHRIVDGVLVWQALKKLGYKQVYVQVIDHLSEAEIEALRIGLHAVAEMGKWDDANLTVKLEHLFRVDPMLVEFTALPTAKIDALMMSGFEKSEVGAEDEVPPPKVSRLVADDLFVSKPDAKRTGVQIRAICGDAKDPEVVARLLGGNAVRLLFSDVPYCIVPIKGVVSKRHDDFQEGASMDEPAALAFFRSLLEAATPHVVDGGAVMLFIDHRGMFALTQATRDVKLKHVCTAAWDKQAGGMGSLYRHQVEFVLVMAKGERIAVNNVQLGKFKRNRSTMWSCPGMGQFGPDREAALEAHPTVKPVQLCADAILDVTHPGEWVLDTCMGTGTTLIAAQRIGRSGAGIELDPAYFEVALRRLQAVGVEMIHEQTGLTLDALIDQRAALAAAQA